MTRSSLYARETVQILYQETPNLSVETRDLYAANSPVDYKICGRQITRKRYKIEL